MAHKCLFFYKHYCAFLIENKFLSFPKYLGRGIHLPRVGKITANKQLIMDDIYSEFTFQKYSKISLIRATLFPIICRLEGRDFCK